MRRRPPRLLTAALAFALGAGITAYSLDDETPDAVAQDGDTLPAGARSEREIDFRLASSLQPFDECGDLLDHVRREAAAHAGTLGFLGGDRAIVTDALSPVAAAAPAAPGAAAAPGSLDETVNSRTSEESAAADAPGTPGFSGTNVQEVGVDEPDTVKTDGRRLFTTARGRVQAVDVTDGRPRTLGTLDLTTSGSASPDLITSGSASPDLPDAGGAQLLLAGDRLLVVSSGWGAQPFDGTDRRLGGPTAGDMAVPGREHTVLRLVDVSDPARMRVLSTLEVDGHLAGARMVGDVVRVVTSASPTGLRPAYAQGRSADDAEQARQANVRQVEESTLVNWLPSFRLEIENPATGGPAVTSGLLVACDRVSHPVEFSGLGTTSVLTFDLGRPDLGDGDATTVLADAETVYASAGSLYVATTRHLDLDPASPEPARPQPAAGTTTEIHRFDITGDGPARHAASGRVRGHVLNQFSLSEHDGHLRVATTDGFPGTAGPESESFVTVLAERDGRLSTTGEVGNLGRGERIYAVRFQGPVGYVVTFRQVDPLYTLDLSDPTRPRVVGELKIPGYSAYLHPLGGGLLLGIGQDATDTGRRLGAQMSLFDVSDPAHPQRLHQAPLGSGSSAVEYDHHAFLWWGARHLAVLPVQTWEGPDPFSGVVGFRVERAGLDEIGRVSHERPAGRPAELGGSPVTRSLVVGESLLTLSEDGILASGLGDLAPRDWAAFP